MAKATYWARRIGLWGLTLVLALMFLMVGLNKFTSTGWIERFANWGYPDHFVYVIGALEMVGALGLLLPRFASYAAGGLIIIMIGAILTHLVHGEPVWPLLHIALLSIVLYARRPASFRQHTTRSASSGDASSG